MDDRKKALELFAKQLSEGLPFAEDFIKGDHDIENNALLARNLAGESLAHNVIKDTNISVPHSGASISKKEDFLNRVVAEHYPEIKDPNIRIGAEDSYSPRTGGILVRDNEDLTKTLGKTLHEAGHKYDNDVLGFKGQNLDLKTLRDAKKSGLDLKNADPMQVYDVYAKGHHARIPDLRDADNFELGALKSYLKNGTFKQIAGTLPLVGGVAAAAMSGDASAAVPLLDEADDVGESKSDEFQMLAEDKARKDYNNSPARLDAIKKLSGR